MAAIEGAFCRRTSKYVEPGCQEGMARRHPFDGFRPGCRLYCRPRGCRCRACRSRRAVTLICAGWVPQDGAVRLELLRGSSSERGLGVEAERLLIGRGAGRSQTLPSPTGPSAGVTAASVRDPAFHLARIHR